MKQLIIPLVAFMAGCGTYKCYPSKGSKDYATLISNERTMLGYKHLFLTGKGDTIVRYLNTKLNVGNCYEVWIE